jgi:putative flippase GtrA
VVRALLRNLIDGPLLGRLRRFVAVGVFTAGVQMVLLWVFVDSIGINYLFGAVIAIEFTIILSYVLNNAWTFQATQNTGLTDYVVGLLKTNVVRGTAIPIQLVILFVLVEWAAVMYLIANGIAIFISGLYRYVLDARWTWG